MVEYILLKCFSDSCGMYQVLQRTKTNKFSCKVCNSKQSVKKVFAVSYKAKDLRDLCMTYNMEKGNASQQKAKEKRKIEEIREQVGRDEIEHYFDEPSLDSTQNPSKKSKWAVYEENAQHEEEEEDEEANYVLIKPETTKKSRAKNTTQPNSAPKTKATANYKRDENDDNYYTKVTPKPTNNPKITPKYNFDDLDELDIDSLLDDAPKVTQKDILKANAPPFPKTAPTTTNLPKTNHDVAQPKQSNNATNISNSAKSSNYSGSAQPPLAKSVPKNITTTNNDFTRTTAKQSNNTMPLPNLASSSNPLANLPKKAPTPAASQTSKWAQYTEAKEESSDEEEDFLWDSGAQNNQVVEEERV